jgi:hypothetical protein
VSNRQEMCGALVTDPLGSGAKRRARSAPSGKISRFRDAVVVLWLWPLFVACCLVACHTHPVVAQILRKDNDVLMSHPRYLLDVLAGPTATAAPAIFTGRARWTDRHGSA